MGGVLNSKNLAMYTYSHQNPIKFVDPDGKKVIFTKEFIIEYLTNSDFRGSINSFFASKEGRGLYNKLHADDRTISVGVKSNIANDSAWGETKKYSQGKKNNSPGVDFDKAEVDINPEAGNESEGLTTVDDVLYHEFLHVKDAIDNIGNPKGEEKLKSALDPFDVRTPYEYSMPRDKTPGLKEKANDAMFSIKVFFNFLTED